MTPQNDCDFLFLFFTMGMCSVVGHESNMWRMSPSCGNFLLCSQRQLIRSLRLRLSIWSSSVQWRVFIEYMYTVCFYNYYYCFCYYEEVLCIHHCYHYWSWWWCWLNYLTGGLVSKCTLVSQWRVTMQQKLTCIHIQHSVCTQISKYKQVHLRPHLISNFSTHLSQELKVCHRTQ